MMTVRCPGCKNKMKYEARPGPLADKRKRCVYCGRTFNIKDFVVGES